MAYRSASDVDVASRALVMSGTKPINSFEDGTVEADVARLLYEDIAAAALTSTSWRFAMTQRELNRLSVKPVGRGVIAWQVPADCLQIRALTINSTPAAFERYENNLHTDAVDENSVAVLEYTRRVDTASWPPHFVIAVQHMLASEFSIAIGQNEQLSNLHAQKGQMLIRNARSIDAQGRTNSVMDTKRYLNHRRT